MARPSRSGRFWLRRCVRLGPEAQRHDLTVRLGPVAEVYQLYANGTLVGSTGPFDESFAQIGRPRAFRIPADIVGSRPDLHLALRLLSPAYFPISSTSLGGDYLLIHADRAIAQERTIPELAVRTLSMLVFGCLRLFLSVVLVVVWTSERKRIELLWLAAFVAASAMNSLMMSAMQMKRGSPEAHITS